MAVLAREYITYVWLQEGRNTFIRATISDGYVSGR